VEYFSIAMLQHLKLLKCIVIITCVIDHREVPDDGLNCRSKHVVQPMLI
jgi:hypothetical protein